MCNYTKFLTNNNIHYENSPNSKCEYFVKRLFIDSLDDMKCQKDCPKTCEFMSFPLAVSNSEFPSKGYYSILKKKLGDVPREALLSLNVFYKSSSYIHIEEVETYTFSEFISELGGCLSDF
jgi:hypothetical protein